MLDVLCCHPQYLLTEASLNTFQTLLTLLGIIHLLKSIFNDKTDR